MSAAELHPSFDSTSAAGAMLRKVGKPILVGCMLASLATSTGTVVSAEFAEPWRLPVKQTTAGAAVVVGSSAGAAIGELRRLSGLTWEQLARLFNVNRRSLHFWASGKAMTPSHEEHLQRLLAVIRKLDRGSGSDNRRLLLGASEDGSLPFDALAARDYDGVLAQLGPGGGRKIVPPSRLSAESRAARAPLRPEELVEALQDRIHAESGRVRAAKSVRFRGGR